HAADDQDPGRVGALLELNRRRRAWRRGGGRAGPLIGRGYLGLDRCLADGWVILHVKGSAALGVLPCLCHIIAVAHRPSSPFRIWFHRRPCTRAWAKDEVSSSHEIRPERHT